MKIVMLKESNIIIPKMVSFFNGTRGCGILCGTKVWYFPWERDPTIILAKRCRAERGQVIAVCDGVVKDLTNLPPQEQQRALQMANATDNDARPISVNEMRANQKQKEYQLALLEDATLIRQTDSAQATITLEQRYD